MTSIESALQDVLTRNATGTDRLNRELLLSAFHPEGRLIIPSMDFVAEGHAQVGDLLELQSQFDKTFHFIGNTRFDIADSGDTATGEIYVLAHHLKDGQVRVSAIRYEDSYSRQNGEWRIDERTINIEWNHAHDTIDSVL